MPASPAFLGVPAAPVGPFPRAAGLCAQRMPLPCATGARRCARRAPRMLRGRGRNSGGSLGFALADAPVVPFRTAGDDFSAWSRPGAYAVRDVTGELVYVGYARDVGRRLAFHVTQLPQLCVSFQTYLPDLPRGEITPDLLEGVLEYWVRENGRMPRGNVEDRALWEGTAADRKDSIEKKAAQRTRATQSRAESSPSTTSAPEAGPSPETGRERKAAPRAAEPEPAIPVRERRTPRRRVSERVPFRARSGTFRSGPARRGRGAAWDPADDDYVEVNVDPLDPFTATSHPRTTRDGIWDPSGGEDDGEDWVPIFGLVGVASLIWLFSVLGNALPTAAPSLGM